MSVPPVAPHRPPRHPHVWWTVLLAVHALAAAYWWHRGLVHGAAVALPVMIAAQLAVFWATLRPASPLLGPALTRIPSGERVVWLTIDDGPSDETPAMLDLLDAHGAKATFFLVGDRARARPELVREIARRGHGVGNHSDTHPTGRFWALGPRAMARQIERAQATLTELAGEAPVWFRAVVGMANPFVFPVLRRLGLARVAWSARGFDGRIGDPDRVLARVERQLAPGAIVLAHEGAPHGRNVEMMARLLRRLDELGYRCVIPVPDAVPGAAPPRAQAAPAE